MLGYLNSLEEKAIGELKKKLTDMLADKLYKIILYGSKARGDYDRESDIDLLVVVNNLDLPTSEIISSIVYDIELKSHYWNVSSNVIWNIVKTKLDIFDLSSMLNVPSIWTYEKNINYNLIYDLIRFFYKSINTEKIIPCIIELDKNNSLYKIYKMMWSLSLWLDNNFVNNTNKKYNSDICVFPNPVNDFKSKFDLPFRELIKKHKLK